MLTAGCGGAAPAVAAPGHPRILLNGATLSGLRARARGGAADWRALRSACDVYRPGAVQVPAGNDYPPEGGIGEGYQGSGYYPAVWALGVCYQVARGVDPARAARYGRIGAELVSKMATTGEAGAPYGRDDVYGIRFYGAGLALGYDWFHDQLDDATRAHVRSVVATWIKAYELVGYAHDFPQENYYAGYYAAAQFAALAFEGEGGTFSWQHWLRDVHDRFVRRYYQQNLPGGGWPEGWNYGPLATFNQSIPVLAARSAKGVDLLRGYRFPLGTGRFIVYFTWPDRTTWEDSGAVYSSPDPTAAQPWLFTAQAAILEAAHDPFAPYLRSFGRAVHRAFRGIHGLDVLDPPWWQTMEFLFGGHGRERDFHRLPTSYLARGIDMAAVRSDWSTAAVWGAFNGGPYINDPGNGEEYYDKGSLAIMNGRRPFLVNATGALQRWSTYRSDDGSPYEEPVYDDIFGDTAPRSLFNVFYAGRDPGAGQGFKLRAEGAHTRMSAFEDRGGSVFMRSSDLQQQYPWHGPRVIRRWTREVVYLRPGTFVVHDRTLVTSSALDQRMHFHLSGRPAPVAAAPGVNAYDVRFRGAYAGRVDTILPRGGRDRTVDVFGSHKVFRIERHVAGAPGQEWLTVFDAARSAGHAAHAEPLTVTAGAAAGVLLRRGGHDEVVVLSRREPDRPLAAMAYRVPAGPTRHLVAGLRPGAAYAVSISRAGGTLAVRIHRGGARRTGPAGVLRFTTG